LEESEIAKKVKSKIVTEGFGLKPDSPAWPGWIQESGVSPELLEENRNLFVLKQTFFSFCFEIILKFLLHKW
jgi:hypothetical protein